MKVETHAQLLVLVLHSFPRKLLVMENVDALTGTNTNCRALLAWVLQAGLDASNCFTRSSDVNGLKTLHLC